jgi:hypothetical protein
MKRFIAYNVLIFLTPIFLIITVIAFLLRMLACWLGDWGMYLVKIARLEHENQN